MDKETPTPNQVPLRRPVRAIPQQQEDGEKKQRIKLWMATIMVVAVISIDIFNALLNLFAIGEVLSSIISPIATFAFVIWFWILGANFVKKPKKLAAMGGQAIIGLIPVINTLPELTLGVIITILLTRSEDKGGLLSKATNITQEKIKPKITQRTFQKSRLKSQRI